MTSNFRKIASQVCAFFPYNCLQFTYGSFTGCVVILIAELHKKDSEIPATVDQLSWFASLELMKPICTIITGLLMHRWGCRPVAFVSALLYVAAGLIYYYSTTVTMIFVGRVLTFLLSVPTIANPYTSEISEPHLRSRLFTVALLSTVIGALFALLLASLMYWRTAALVILIIPVLSAVTILATPQSPTWLASKGRLDKAKKSLCWVRGWVKPNQVQAEFDTLVESVQKSNSISGIRTFAEAVTWKQRLKAFLNLYIQRSFYVPLGTTCLLFLLYALNGVMTIEIYSTVIYRSLNSPIEGSVATVIMELMGVIGILVVLFIVRRMDNKNLILVCVVATGLCFAVVALVGFLKLKGQYLWISTIAMTLPRFLDAMGIAAFLFMLPSEIFPPSVRYIGTSTSFSVKIILDATVKKLFAYIVMAFTVPGTFAFFAFMNLVGVISYYFLLSETEDKSLRQNENRYITVKREQEREQDYELEIIQ